MERQSVIVGIACLIAGIAVGHFGRPASVVEKEKIVSVYDEAREARAVKQAIEAESMRLSQKSSTTVTKRVEKKADGSFVADMKEETRFSLSVESEKKVETVSVDEQKAKLSFKEIREKETTVTYDQPRWMLMGSSTLTQQYSLGVGYRVIGPVWIWGSSTLSWPTTVSIGFALTF